MSIISITNSNSAFHFSQAQETATRQVAYTSEKIKSVVALLIVFIVAAFIPILGMHLAITRPITEITWVAKLAVGVLGAGWAFMIHKWAFTEGLNAGRMNKLH